MRRTFWRTLFWLILIVGIYALFPASEIEMAKRWMEGVLARWK